MQHFFMLLQCSEEQNKESLSFDQFIHVFINFIEIARRINPEIHRINRFLSMKILGPNFLSQIKTRLKVTRWKTPNLWMRKMIMPPLVSYFIWCHYFWGGLPIVVCQRKINELSCWWWLPANDKWIVSYHADVDSTFRWVIFATGKKWENFFFIWMRTSFVEILFSITKL